MSRNRRRLVASCWFVCVAMLLAGCGQRPGASYRTGFGGQAVGPGGVGPGGVGPGGTVPGATGPGGTGVGPGGTGVGPGGTGPGGTGPGGAPIAAGPGDRTGVTPTTITIGVHAPLSGAAPIEPAAFDKGKDLYWRWLHEMEKKKVHGRTIKVEFRNDEYSPTTAVSVCNTMATQERSFLLIGGAGTDQIKACAQYSNPRGIPYLSPGVQESGVNSLQTYFAVTMTYKQQMPLLVQMLKKVGGSGLNKYGGAASKIKVGFVRPNTSNFNDAAEALKQASQAAGYEYKAYTVVKEGNQQESQTVAAQMQRDEVDVVVPITPPTFTTTLAINAGKNGYKPKYAGVAISNNINQMIAQVCRNQEFEGALFFSPWAGWKQVIEGQYDPDFVKAADNFAAGVNKRGKGGDLLLAFWGIMKMVHAALEAAGPDLTRQKFIATLTNFSYKNGLFPDLNYSPTDHFGAKNVHLLEGRCSESLNDRYGGRGPQWVEHPQYPGLRSSF